MNDRERLEAQAEILEQVAAWSRQPDHPTGAWGVLSHDDLQLRAAALRAQADVLPPEGCGGCRGEGAHRRVCPRHPDYTPYVPIMRAAEDLGDRVGSNNPGLANTFYAAAGELRRMHINALAVKIRRSSEHGLDRGPQPDPSGEDR